MKSVVIIKKITPLQGNGVYDNQYNGLLLSFNRFIVFYINNIRIVC